MTLVGGYHEATGWLHNQSLLLSRSSVHSISNMEQEGSTYEFLAGITYCAPCQ
ncbi:unnamed protein product [Musa acuminata subsp. burmannicoides]